MTITVRDLPDVNPSNDNDLVAFTTEIIKGLEGFVPFIYADGKGIPTIGYGVALVTYNSNKPIGEQWAIRDPLEIIDIFDGVGHQLNDTDLSLLQEAARYLNGNKDPVTGVVTDAAGNVLTNPFHQVNPSAPNPADNVTSWTIAPTDGEQMIKNLLTSDPSRPETQASDLVEKLRLQLGPDNSGNDLWDTYQDSREGAALLSLWYNGQSAVIPTDSRLIQALKDGDRAAWVEIRYFSNAQRGDPAVGLGIQNRRDKESEVFGLFDTADGKFDAAAADAAAQAQATLGYLYTRVAAIVTNNTTQGGFDTGIDAWGGFSASRCRGKNLSGGSIRQWRGGGTYPRGRQCR